MAVQRSPSLNHWVSWASKTLEFHGFHIKLAGGYDGCAFRQPEAPCSASCQLATSRATWTTSSLFLGRWLWIWRKFLWGNRGDMIWRYNHKGDIMGYDMTHSQDVINIYIYIILCYIILYYIISYHIILYYIILLHYYIILYYTITLYYIILYYIILYYTILYNISLYNQ